MARGINMEKLLQKIATVTNSDFEELKESSRQQLQTYEEMVLERQAVYNYFTARVQPRQGKDESDHAFQLRYDEWRIRVCEECENPFAYAFSYEGVKFCSLDCLDGALRKIGLRVTPNRDPKKRWGLYHPAIVSSSALNVLQSFSQESS